MQPLTSSVGAGGKNLTADVMTVQRLLKVNGFPVGSVDGICGKKTIAAITQFQSKFLPKPDGLISSGGPTWKRLSATDTKPPTPALDQWTGDSAQWSKEKKLASMTPLLRPKVEAVLASLEAQGFQPKIFYGWRSVAVQLQLYKQGNTKVKFGFHNAQNIDGSPNSYAADIIDSRYAWSDKASTSGFWAALGKAAKEQGLIWGGDWASFRDWAHVQLVENSELGRVKRESGL